MSVNVLRAHIVTYMDMTVCYLQLQTILALSSTYTQLFSGSQSRWAQTSVCYTRVMTWRHTHTRRCQQLWMQVRWQADTLHKDWWLVNGRQDAQIGAISHTSKRQCPIAGTKSTFPSSPFEVHEMQYDTMDLWNTRGQSDVAVSSLTWDSIVCTCSFKCGARSGSPPITVYVN